MAFKVFLPDGSIILAVVSRKQKNKKRKVRCTWVRPWLKCREELGVFDTLVQELRSEEEMEIPNVFVDEPRCI